MQTKDDRYSWKLLVNSSTPWIKFLSELVLFQENDSRKNSFLIFDLIGEIKLTTLCNISYDDTDNQEWEVPAAYLVLKWLEW